MRNYINSCQYFQCIKKGAGTFTHAHAYVLLHQIIAQGTPSDIPPAYIFPAVPVQANRDRHRCNYRFLFCYRVAHAGLLALISLRYDDHRRTQRASNICRFLMSAVSRSASTLKRYWKYDADVMAFRCSCGRSFGVFVVLFSFHRYTIVE